MELLSVKSKKALQKAARHLQEGGIIVYPTETSYGIGALVTDIHALESIKELKGRGKKPFLALVSSIPMANRYAKLGPIGSTLAKTYWPGPLTLVAIPKKRLPLQHFNPKNEIALRYSAHQFATELVRTLRTPITSTSANLAGKPPCYSVPAIIRQFGKRRLQDVLIIDGGRLPRTKPTTLVIVKGSSMKVVRKGSLTI